MLILSAESVRSSNRFQRGGKIEILRYFRHSPVRLAHVRNFTRCSTLITGFPFVLMNTNYDGRIFLINVRDSFVRVPLQRVI